MTGEPDLVAALVKLVASAEPDGTWRVDRLVRSRGGASREAWAFDLTDERRATEPIPCFLLRTAAAGLIQGDTAREFAVLRAVHRAGIPVPEPLWLDRDGTWLGRPGYVSRRVDGESNRRFLAAEERAADRRGVDHQFVEVLAAIHSLDWASLDLPDPPVPDTVSARELEHWASIALGDDPAPEPGLVEAIAWLRGHVPACPRPSLVHGDYRYGNFLYVGGRITAVLDWEMAHIGDPVEDLIWPYRPFRRGTAPLAPWNEVRARWEALTGQTVSFERLAFHRVLAELKTTAIYLTGARVVLAGRVEDLQLANAAFVIPYTIRQMLHWIDQLEATCS